MIKMFSGTYEMGTANIAEPVHLVKFTRSFYLSKYEITWKQWRIVRDNARSLGFTLNDGYSGSLNNGDDNQPVVSVSWWDAVKWCNALSLINGKTPRYYTNEIFNNANITKTSSGTELVCINWNANGYRLPTEAEWEYSCRANSNSIYFWGDAYTSDAINPYAWYYGNSVVSGVWKTNVIGLKNCNDYGLFDMAGNAREWCNDWYGTYLTDSQVDPVGVTSGTLTDRVVRGGYFRTSGSLLSSAERDAAIPSTVNTSYTFRICIEE